MGQRTAPGELRHRARQCSGTSSLDYRLIGEAASAIFWTTDVNGR
jgi:hypothetical protein